MKPLTRPSIKHLKSLLLSTEPLPVPTLSGASFDRIACYHVASHVVIGRRFEVDRHWLKLAHGEPPGPFSADLRQKIDRWRKERTLKLYLRRLLLTLAAGVAAIKPLIPKSSVDDLWSSYCSEDSAAIDQIVQLSGYAESEILFSNRNDLARDVNSLVFDHWSQIEINVKKMLATKKIRQNLDKLFEI